MQESSVYVGWHKSATTRQEKKAPPAPSPKTHNKRTMSIPKNCSHRQIKRMVFFSFLHSFNLCGFFLVLGFVKKHRESWTLISWLLLLIHFEGNFLFVCVKPYTLFWCAAAIIITTFMEMFIRIYIHTHTQSYHHQRFGSARLVTFSLSLIHSWFFEMKQTNKQKMNWEHLKSSLTGNSNSVRVVAFFISCLFSLTYTIFLYHGYHENEVKSPATSLFFHSYSFYQFS